MLVNREPVQPNFLNSEAFENQEGAAHSCAIVSATYLITAVRKMGYSSWLCRTLLIFLLLSPSIWGQSKPSSSPVPGFTGDGECA